MDPRARNWAFTMNHPVSVVTWDPLVMGYLLYSEEEGQAQTRHYQGYVQFIKQTRLSSIKKMSPDWGRAHLEIARGSPQSNVDYCTKGVTHVAGPFIYGTLSVQGQRTDLDSVGQRVLTGATLSDIAETSPSMVMRYTRGLQSLEFISTRKAANEWRNLTVFAFIGVSGTGKTRLAYDVFGASNVYKLNTSTNNTLWFDGYNRERVLLIDDFRGWIRSHELLVLLDGYPYRAPVKGGHTWGLWTVVVITSNTPTQRWYDHSTQDERDALNRRINYEFIFPEETTEASMVLRSLVN